jgi:hypothetical protein
MNAALNTFIFEDISAVHLSNYLKADSLQLQSGGNFITASIPVNILCIGDRTTLVGVQSLNNETRNASSSRMMVDVHQERDNLFRTLKGHEQFIVSSVKTPIESTFSSDLGFVPWASSPSPQLIPGRLGDLNELELVSGTVSDNSLLIWRYKGIPVWKIGSFLPKNTQEFLTVLTTAIESSSNLKDKTLILDVSQNGGGNICLNDLLLTLLVPSWDKFAIPSNNESSVWSLYDLKKNKFNDIWVTQAAELYDDYRDPNTGKPTSAVDWYYSGTVNKTFGTFENVPFIRKA